MNVTSENHNMMQTQVELYFDKELSDITFDTDSLGEWKDLVSELGMDKQLSLTKGKESPVPFPYMNESMKRVYGTLCPTIVNYKEFNKTPIPLEVMKQIAFCVREKHFTDIEIWFDDKTPDPVVVGKTCKYYGYKGASWSSENRTKDLDSKQEVLDIIGSGGSVHETDVNKYLIAKWGDVKRSFSELKVLAKERFIDKHASQMKSDIEVLTGKLKVISENANLYLLGEISESKATTTSAW